MVRGNNKCLRSHTFGVKLLCCDGNPVSRPRHPGLTTQIAGQPEARRRREAGLGRGGGERVVLDGFSGMFEGGGRASVQGLPPGQRRV